jgi:hypothetical protein
MKKSQSDEGQGVEVYSTNFLPNMLYPRHRERNGKQEPIIHRCTGTAQPPVCYVAFSEYRALERERDAHRDRLRESAETLKRIQALVYTNILTPQTPAYCELQELLRAALTAHEALISPPALQS